jgi:transposase
MLMLPPSTRVYVARAPTDLRKGFQGLPLLVTRLGLEPTSGHLFVFYNKRKDSVRVLYWDRTGYCLVAKKLARGRFHLGHPEAAGAQPVEVDAAELALILEGIDLSEAARRKRFRLPAQTSETLLWNETQNA